MHVIALSFHGVSAENSNMKIKCSAFVNVVYCKELDCNI